MESRKVLLKDSLWALPVRIKKLLVAPVQRRGKGMAVAARHDGDRREEERASISRSKTKIAPKKSPWQRRRRFRARLSEAQKHARQLEALNRLQAEFIANVSHELRTPLNGILGYAELLRDGMYGQLAPAQQEVVEHIRACGNHLLDLVNEILDLSRLQQHQMQLEISTIAPVELIEAAAAAVDPLARQRRLNLVTRCEPDLPLLRVDFRRLYQVLLNLLSNAIKFTKEGTVEIGARRESNGIRFHVKDTGIGIAPEFARYVFKEFHQLAPVFSLQRNERSAAPLKGEPPDGVARPFGGVGLGLSLSKRLVELHGGKIAYATKENEGTEFYFHIPIA
ncbi:HAMP domain-containing histidine kinase [candidate division KSB1 bacterium]|nr:HAMP domain-containing histidine kinase [candidate division KSB1 bacterium]